MADGSASSGDVSSYDLTAIIARITSKDAIVAVIGLGYVGVPLALTAVKAGFRVIGVDIDPERIKQIKNAESFLRHISVDSIAEAIRSGRLDATTDFARLSEADAILICVPTPLTRHREPDLSYVTNTAKAIVPYLRRHHLIVLESTTYPGTTTEVLKPLLEQTGLMSGKDFFLAFSPEREDPGNPTFQTASIPKVIGGDGADALAIANALYGELVVKTVPVSSPATAEAVKLTENIFRAVNIALVNELKVIYEAMGVDVWEVIEAAKTKPFGFMPFYPGPGLGGHCIPIDPFYLTWKAREYDIVTHFIELAGQVNTNMPYHIVNRLSEYLDQHSGRGLTGAKILLLGAAYKKNVEDMRESPSLKLIEIIEKRGAITDYYDPYIPVIPSTREHATLSGRKSIDLKAEMIASYDAALIVTDHDNVDYALVAQHAPLVIDTRNVCAKLGITGRHIFKA